ncbi:MAG: glycosyltransferase family 2 protein [Verrucomicrobiae bacterium]|jgi:glycosyltransferase involved in cell wall biosynthesis|nr:glycosyltransferase family 2 protein [Verrucomicrobiae bacterium]
MNILENKISVVIPCYKVKKHILDVISKIGSEVSTIYVIDDCCPEDSGQYAASLSDARIKVIYHRKNQGVGGAVMTGYVAAISDGATIIVKIDGDGQMDPSLIPKFIAPILSNEADYTKGNRFFDVESVRNMPKIRLIGNIALSFLTKLSSGYWNLFDPTNGYTAISACVAQCLPFAKINKRYFFESDILFRLNTLNAVITDIPMNAIYSNEQSGHNAIGQIWPFFISHLINIIKRFFYNYIFRNFNFASIECIIGIFLFSFGMIFGLYNWIRHSDSNTLASSGTVMLSALPIILGLQLLLGFINYDMSKLPSIPINRNLTSQDK